MSHASPPIYELDLALDDVSVLLRQGELLHPNSRRRLVPGRPTRCSEIWHDTPDGDLAADGLSLSQSHAGGSIRWRLQTLVPQAGAIAAPGLHPALISEHDAPPDDIAAPLVPIAAFDGTIRVLRPADLPPQILLMQGELRAVAAVRPVCRVVLCGEGASALALNWSRKLHLHAPTDTLAGEALRLSGRVLPLPPLGAPHLSDEHSVSEAFATLVSHLAGVLAHYAPLADGSNGPEPVHQMRVALRRLRSAMSLFRRAVDCPALEEARPLLKQLGQVLGPARDWDVFTAGIGRHIGKAFAEDAAVHDLLAAAERKRATGYVGLARFLAGPHWRELGIALAILAAERPWEQSAPVAVNPVAVNADNAEALAEAERRAALQSTSLPEFAVRALSRRYRALIAPGPDLTVLPIEALHDIRLAGKRLRYAAEFFAPLFAGRETKRFLRRMAELQERLGQINDAAVADGLMAQLGGRGTARAGAVGVVRGFVAASSATGRRRIERCWKRLLRHEGFWH